MWIGTRNYEWSRNVKKFHGASKCCPPIKFVQTYVLNAYAERDLLCCWFSHMAQ